MYCLEPRGKEARRQARSHLQVDFISVTPGVSGEVATCSVHRTCPYEILLLLTKILR